MNSKIDDRKNNEYLTNRENTQAVQKIIEKLSFLHFQQKNINDKARKDFHEKVASTHISKIVDIMDFMEIHNEILTFSKTILSSSISIQFTMEVMNTLWIVHNNFKNETKNIINVYKSKLAKLANIQTHLVNLKVKKDILIDDLVHYRNMWNLQISTNSEEMIQYENDFWSILTSVSSAASVPKDLLKIDENLSEKTINTVESKIRVYLIEGRTDENISSFILSIAKRVIYLQSPIIGSNLIEKASKLLEKFCPKTSMKINLLPLAEAFCQEYQNNYEKAGTLARTAIKNLNNIQSLNDSQKCYLKFKIAFLLIRWGFVEEGLILLEETSGHFEIHFPDTEILWRKNMLIRARVYNDFHKFDFAHDICVKIIRRYHMQLFGPITQKNKPIYEIATDIFAKTYASSQLMETISGHSEFLPPYLVDMLKELIIVYAAKKNFNAVRFVERYLIDCIESYKINGMNLEESDDICITLNLEESKKSSELKMIAKNKKLS